MRVIPPEQRMIAVPDADGDAAGLLDLQYVRDVLGFGLRSIARHRRAVITIFCSVMALALAALVLMPRQYLTQTSLFAQRNFVMPALGNPRRTVPMESDAPTRLARETVMKRENLVAIIKQTSLLDTWDSTRPLVLRFKDAVVRLLPGEPSQEDRINALVGTLERRMWVNADEGTVTIGVLWSDPNTAYRIIDAAQRNFIEERHASEVATIQESITILEEQATNVRTAIEQGYRELRRETPVADLPVAPRRNRAAEEKIASLQSTLTAKRLAIADLEAFTRRRLAELQARLSEQRNTYGPRHPALASTEQSIQQLSVDSPQLVQLRQEEQRLVAELRGLGVDANAAGQPATSAGFDQSLARAAIASLSRAREDSVRAERASYLRARIQMSENEYEDLLQRLQGARIELETARAAFKYRYGVITPPQVPKRAMSPKPVLFIAGGFVLAVMMAVFAAVAIDVGGGRVIESWQAERLLGLKVLREVNAP